MRIKTTPDRKTALRFFASGLFLFFSGLLFAQSPAGLYSQADSYKALADLLEKNPPAVVSLTEPLNGTRPLDASLQTLRSQVNELNVYLKKSGPIGAKWQKVLRMPELLAETKKSNPDLTKLEDCLGAFQSHLWGLEVDIIKKTGQCIQDYIGIRIIIEDKIDVAESLKGVLPDLIKTLKSADSGSFKSAQELDQFLNWAAQYRQMSDVCQQIRKLGNRNNFFLTVSDRFVYRFLNRPVNRTVGVQETILGIPQRGSMTLEGSQKFQLVPSADSILLRLSLDASGSGKTTAYAERGVRVFSTATNKITATKDISFDGVSFKSTPAQANVSVESHVTGISAPTPMVQRAAENRVADSRAAANREATMKAQKRTCSNLDQEVRDLTNLASKQLDSFSLVYKERGIFPSPLICSTSEKQVTMEGLTQSFFAFCPQARPEFKGDFDVCVAVHQSSPMEIGKGLLANLKANEKTFLMIANSLLPQKAYDKVKAAAEERKKKTKASSEEEDATQGFLFFNAGYPVNVEFRDGGIRLAVRIDGFQSASGKKIQETPMNIEVCYKPQISKDEKGASIIRFVLQDKVQFVPRDFENRKRSLSKEETTLRNRLGDTIEKALPREFVIESQDLLVKKNPEDEKPTEKIGTLSPAAIVVQSGWLQIGWKVLD